MKKMAQQSLKYRTMRSGRALVLRVLSATCLLACAQAHAAGVLVLVPVPETLPVPAFQDILANVKAEFPGATYLDAGASGPGITSATFDPGYDLVVVMQPVSGGTAEEFPSYPVANAAAIMAAIEARRAPAFVLFGDSGGTGRTDGIALVTVPDDLASRLNTIGGLTIETSEDNLHLGNDVVVKRNVNSPFSTGLSDEMTGGFFHYLDKVPAPNVLYVDSADTLPAVGSMALQDHVYGVIVPQVQSYEGNGACVMAFTDLTLLESRNGVYVANKGKIGAPIMAAASTGGACESVVDLEPDIDGPAEPVVGSPSSYTLTISNSGQIISHDGTVKVTLPANMVLAAQTELPAGCTRDSGTQMSCDLATTVSAGIPASGASRSIDIAFNATATGPVAGTSIEVVVADVSFESKISNNSTQHPLNNPPPPDLLPTISGPALPPLNVFSVYTVQIRNEGSGASHDGTVQVTLPPNMVLAAQTDLPAGCTRSSATQLSCLLTTIAPAGIPPGGNVPFTFSATATGPVAGTAIEVVVADVSSELDRTDNATRLPLSDVPLPPPDLVPALSGPATPPLDAPSTYTVQIRNEGSGASHDGTVRVTLPPNMVLATQTELPAGCTRSSATQLSCLLATLAPAGIPPGGNVPFTFSATATGPVAGTSIEVVVADVSAELDRTDNATRLLLSDPPPLPPDLVPALSGPATPPLDAPSTYTVQIRNEGGLASSDGTVQITLPPNMVLAAQTDLPAGCTRDGDTQLSCSLNTIAPGSNVSLSFVAAAAGSVAGSAIDVEVFGVSMEVDTDDNVTQLVLNDPPPDLVPEISGPPAPPLNSPSQYVVKVINEGGLARDGTLTVTLPAGMVLAAQADLPAECVRDSDTQMSCTLARLELGAAIEVGFSATLTMNLPAGSQIQASVADVTGEVVMTNNAGMLPLFASAITAVPVLNFWGMLMTGLAAAGIGARRLRRRSNGSRASAR